MFGTLAFAAVCLGMLLASGGLAYFAFYGSGRLEIARGDGQLTIRTSSDRDQRPQTAQPAKSVAPPEGEATQPHDPIIGSLGQEDSSDDGELNGDGQPRSLSEDQPAAARREEASEESISADDQSEMSAGDVPEEGEDVPADSSAVPEETSSPPPVAAPDAAASTMSNEDDSDSTPGTPSSPAMAEDADGGAAADPSAERIATGKEAIARARQSVASANWDDIESDVRQARDAAVTGDQRRQAKRLAELVDHALYYRGGITRGMQQLSAGHELKIGPIEVIVVEASADALTIRRGARNLSYAVDELPPSLAHTLANFSMAADDPQTQVARSVYESIAPTFDEQYRRDTVAQLRELDDEAVAGSAVEGIDPTELAETIEWLFR